MPHQAFREADLGRGNDDSVHLDNLAAGEYPINIVETMPAFAQFSQSLRPTTRAFEGEEEVVLGYGEPGRTLQMDNLRVVNEGGSMACKLLEHASTIWLFPQ